MDGAKSSRRKKSLRIDEKDGVGVVWAGKHDTGIWLEGISTRLFDGVDWVRVTALRERTAGKSKQDKGQSRYYYRTPVRRCTKRPPLSVAFVLSPWHYTTKLLALLLRSLSPLPSSFHLLLCHWHSSFIVSSRGIGIISVDPGLISITPSLGNMPGMTIHM